MYIATSLTRNSCFFLITKSVCCQWWFPRYIGFALSTRCGVCHPKGVIVSSSYNKPVLYLFPTSYTFKNSMKCLIWVHWQSFTRNLKKLLLDIASYSQTQFKKNFEQMVVFQNWFNFSTEILTEIFGETGLTLYSSVAFKLRISKHIRGIISQKIILKNYYYYYLFNKICT